MRVLLITEFFPRSNRGEITGGVEARYFFLNKYLPLHGVKTEVLFRSHGSKGTKPGFKSLLAWATFYYSIWKKSQDLDFDLVEGANFLTYPLAWLIGITRRKPIIFCYHDVYLGSWVKKVGPIGLIGEMVERIALILPGVTYLMVSKTVRNKVKAVKRNLNSYVSYNGVELASKTQRQRKSGLICVTRLIPYKHVDRIIRSVAQLRDQKIVTKLQIVGQGPELSTLKALVKELNLKKQVSFLGFLPSHQLMLQHVRRSTIFCSASTVEGFGIALIESAAQGTPYVAVCVPAVKEVTKNGLGGFLVPPDDQAALVGAIKQLMKVKTYTQKQKEANILAQSYSWDKIAKELSVIYRKTAKTKRS